MKATLRIWTRACPGAGAGANSETWMPSPASLCSVSWFMSHEHVFHTKQSDPLNSLEMLCFQSQNHREKQIKNAVMSRDFFFHSNTISKCWWIFTLIINITFAHIFLELLNYCRGSSPLINSQADTLSQNHISLGLIYPNSKIIKAVYLQQTNKNLEYLSFLLSW